MAEFVNLSEEEKIKRRLKMSYTERFKVMMQLYKLGVMMKKAAKKTKANGHT